MYLGAEHLIGFFTVWPSAQWYSYFGPADMMGQLSSVQNSVMVPYNMLIWLKKSTAKKTELQNLDLVDVKLIMEVQNARFRLTINSNPLVQILSFGKHNGQSQITRT